MGFHPRLYAMAFSGSWDAGRPPIGAGLIGVISERKHG
ncbi:hypothetical protein CSB95_2377 [Pseudomonas aeruginosa]|nr:Hypothetical protein SCV20265_3857 [Pseudomonas aeruginosa SCV20265]ARI01027.1 hypothetical protein Y880_0991 [Pseudomonas aeruginosa PAK]AVJ94358.1 hypothetical protein CSB97_2538 [Pseudomonas aeruginosa]CCQ86797.1 hypothetical protein PA18A_3408 [Pseudomonas aeruginosa 18A]SMZ51713.1 hypothetical protein PANN_38760 [Pseudomonas aeruginosa C-NN2]GAA17103.1 hypothetical protein NCGM1179_1927 [Pseudomonas aeruginosa NCMG1179]